MKNKPLVTVAVLLIAVALAPERLYAQTFDKQDLPQVERMKALDWKGIDLEKVDAKAQYAALQALQEVISIAEEKAEVRREMLAGYLEAVSLVDDFLAEQPKPPEQRLLAFEEARKIAVAYVRSSLSGGRFDVMGEDDPAAFDRLAAAQLKLCEKHWSQTRADRREVELLATYVRAKGRFEDYRKWAAEESKKRQASRDAEMAARREEFSKAAAAKKEAAEVLAQQRRREQHELDMKRLEYAYQTASQQQIDTPWNSWLDDDIDIYYPYGYHVWRAPGPIGKSIADRWKDRPRPAPARR